MSSREALGIVRRVRTLPQETQVSLAIPLGGILLAELLLSLGNHQPALGVHLATLFVCVFAPTATRVVDIDILQAFALVSLFRLVNLGMPVFLSETLLWIPFVYLPLVPACYLIAKSSPFVNLSLKPKFTLLTLPATVLLGGVLGYAEYLILRPNPLVTSLSIGQLVLITVVMIGFVGLVEEFLFRSVLQTMLANAVGVWSAISITGIVFGLMHSGYQTIPGVLFTILVGGIFGVLYWRTESLLTVGIARGILNVFVFAIIPLSSAS